MPTRPATITMLLAEFGGEGWKLEAQGSEIYGSLGPTAGPPPYRIYRLEATKVIGQPGMDGMFETDQHLKPTRWTFPAQ